MFLSCLSDTDSSPVSLLTPALYGGSQIALRVQTSGLTVVCSGLLGESLGNETSPPHRTHSVSQLLVCSSVLLYLCCTSQIPNLLIFFWSYRCPPSCLEMWIARTREVLRCDEEWGDLPGGEWGAVNLEGASHSCQNVRG